MMRSRSASTAGLPEMHVKCVPYAASWLSPRDFLRVFVDQGTPRRIKHRSSSLCLLSLRCTLFSPSHTTVSRSLPLHNARVAARKSATL